MVSALGLVRAPRLVRRAAVFAFSTLSRRLGKVLARFDQRVGALGIARAAAMALSDLGATWERTGSVAAAGPVLVVTNHPGAYDALALMAAIDRDDLAIVAADRAFLRALPQFACHLSFVSDELGARVPGLRSALRHLAAGGVLLHFGAGRIEPDPAFPKRGEPLLAAWPSGTGALVRSTAKARGHVVAAVVDGVHSPRAKRLFVTRLAERRGVTTLATLLQVAIPAYREVHARVRFTSALEAQALVDECRDDAAIAARVRDRTLQRLASPT
jgi:hypothetical protein